MKASERNDLLYGLIQNYVNARRDNIVYGRSAQERSYATGRLNGALTAFEMDMEETAMYVIIRTHKNKEIMRYPLHIDP